MADDKQEQLERLRRLTLYGEELHGPLRQLPGGVVPAPGEGKAFTVADLLTLSPPAQEVRIAGKRVWVHPPSTEAVARIHALTLRSLADNGVSGVEEANEYRFRAHIYQVICTCRQGEEPDSPLCFGPEHYDVVRRNLPWEDLERIVRLGDRLGGDPAEGIKEAVRGFFGRLQTFCETLCSQLGEGSIEAVREALTSCASSASRMSSAESWTESDLESWQP
jgi:hypothetical protein